MEKIETNSLRIINLKNGKRIFKKNLSLEIVALPESHDIIQDELYKKQINFNEISYIYNSYDITFTFYIFLGSICISLIFYFMISDVKGISLFSLAFAILGTFNLIYSFLKRNKKKMIMYRSQGILQYPDFFLKSPIVTKFENTVAILGGSGSYGALILKLRQTSFFTNYHINNFAPLKYWSFMVWYMDKNRPLPPGNAFDEYRERDFQSRKAEGFPSPLYPSFVPTPEATPEQQAERDKYWEERFTTDENGETLRHFWERDRSLKVKSTQNN